VVGDDDLIDESQISYICPLERLGASIELIGCPTIVHGIETVQGWLSAASCLMLAATLKLQHLLLEPAHHHARIPIVLSRTCWECLPLGPPLYCSIYANPQRVTTILPQYPLKFQGSRMHPLVASSSV
jgi:hypothetical protein